VHGDGGPVSGVGNEYEIRSEEKPTTDLKEGEQAEIGLVPSRAGMLVAVPVRRVGKAGETKVEVIDTGGDKTIQQYFRQLIEMSEAGKLSFATGGYTIRTKQCTLCKNGRTIDGRVCPKCGGTGIIESVI